MEIAEALELMDDCIIPFNEEKERFEIKDLEQANWAFRKLHELQDQQDKIDLLAKKERDRITQWHEKESKNVSSSKEFFEGLLTAFYLTEKASNPKAKVSTPYGKITSRKSQPKWEYDESVALEWCRGNGLVRVKEEIDKAGLKKVAKVVGGRAVTADGELVPGVQIVNQPDSIKISLEA